MLPDFATIVLLPIVRYTCCVLRVLCVLFVLFARIYLMLQHGIVAEVGGIPRLIRWIVCDGSPG